MYNIAEFGKEGDVLLAKCWNDVKSDIRYDHSIWFQSANFSMTSVMYLNVLLILTPLGPNEFG